MNILRQTATVVPAMLASLLLAHGLTALASPMQTTPQPLQDPANAEIWLAASDDMLGQLRGGFDLGAGLVVNFGTASGQVEGFALQDLHSQSLWVCRPTLRTYIANRADMLAMSVEAFGMLGDPTIRLDIDTLLPLSQASEAHRLLESRTTQGAIVLIPDALMNPQE